MWSFCLTMSGKGLWLYPENRLSIVSKIFEKLVNGSLSDLLEKCHFIIFSTVSGRLF